jgi:hypothetical protein
MVYIWLIIQWSVLNPYDRWPITRVVCCFLGSNKGKNTTIISGFLDQFLSMHESLKPGILPTPYTHAYAYTYSPHGHTCKMNLLMTACRLPLTSSIREGRTFLRPLVISQLLRGHGEPKWDFRGCCLVEKIVFKNDTNVIWYRWKSSLPLSPGERKLLPGNEVFSKPHN